MPTREAKNASGTRWWRLWFLPTSSAKSAQNKFVKGVEGQEDARNAVKILSSEGKQILLEWEHPIKYNGARYNVGRLGSGDQIKIEAAEGQAEPSVNVEVAEGPPEPSEPPVEPSPVEPSLVEPSAVAAEVGTPMHLLVLKFLSKAGVAPTPCDYIVHREAFVGGGTFGNVYEARSRTAPNNRLVAKSMVLRTPNDKETILQELAASVALPAHDNVASVLDIDRDGDRMYLISLHNDADLHRAVAGKPLHEFEVSHLLDGLVAGLAHIHSHGLIHNDLSAKNVLVQRPDLFGGAGGYVSEGWVQQVLEFRSHVVVRIADLGGATAGRLEDRHQTTTKDIAKCGVLAVTAPYRAPELFLGDQCWSYPIDCWALGCITAEMYCGDCFFGRGADAGIFERIVAQLGPIPNDGALSQLPRYGRRPKAPPLKPCWPPQVLSGVPTGHLNLLQGLFEYCPARRLTIDQVRQRFLDPYQRLAVVVSEGPGGRGPASLQQGEMEPALRRWFCKRVVSNTRVMGRRARY